MPTHLSPLPHARLLESQDGGLPGIPGSGPNQPPPIPPSLQKQPATPPPPTGGPLFAQATPPPPVPTDGGTFELSGWWRRVGATLVDYLILLVPFLVIFVALLGVASGTDGSDVSIGALIATTLSWVLLWFLYAPILMWKTNGATIGKKAFGIRVVRTDGAPITFGFAAVREVAVKAFLFGFISNLTFGLGGLLDYLWPLWDSENRALHDMIVKTRVVRG